jgi:signal transduction histidine kinase
MDPTPVLADPDGRPRPIRPAADRMSTPQRLVRLARRLSGTCCTVLAVATPADADILALDGDLALDPQVVAALCQWGLGDPAREQRLDRARLAVRLPRAIQHVTSWPVSTESAHQPAVLVLLDRRAGGLSPVHRQALADLIAVSRVLSPPKPPADGTADTGNGANRAPATVRHLAEDRDFATTASHNLRTPLTAIRAALSLLAGGALGTLPVAAQDVVGIADRNTRRLVAVINDLLDSERRAIGIAVMAQYLTAVSVQSEGDPAHAVRLQLLLGDGALGHDPQRLDDPAGA